METVKTKELAEVLGLSRKGVIEKARKDGWAFVYKGNSMLFVENRLPADVRFAVALYRSGKPVPVQKEEKKDARLYSGDAFLNAGEKAQGEATWRAALIREYNNSGMNVAAFIEVYNGCNAFPVLKEKLGEVSQATFYRWIKAFKESGASGIVPKYGMSRGGAGESFLDEERELLRRFWLKDTQPSAMHAFRLMKANIPYSKCSYQTALRYLNSLPKATAGFFRGGEGRFENAFLPHMEQDITRYRSLDVVVSDHHCLDCVVLYRGELIRPWITTFQDLRSGKVLGWCPCVKPSSLSIVVAYYMCCMRYGIPVCLLFDNGKDYHAKWLNGKTETVTVMTPEGIDEEKEVEFKGLFALVGSDVRFTRTYNGKSKARQERYFRIIGEYLAKEMGSYVGSDSRSRPEEAQLMWRGINGKEQRHDIPTWEDFVQNAEAMIEYINDQIPCSSDYMDGKTRSRVFAECLPPEEEIRHASKEMLQKALVKGEVRQVNRQGVTIGKVNFYSSDLFEFFGRKVRVYINLLDDREVTCFTLDGDFICTAKADYFKETGKLDEDIERLTGERNRLTQIAVLGSGEMTIAPEYETMVDVARRAYTGNQLEGVENFLGNSSEMESSKNYKLAAKKSTLKTPFMKGINIGVKEAKNEQ